MTPRALGLRTLAAIAAVALATAPVAGAGTAGFLRLEEEGGATRYGGEVVSGVPSPDAPRGPDGVKADPKDPETAAATGRRTYEPIVFRKRIDKSSPQGHPASPLIAKALCDNQVIPSLEVGIGGERYKLRKVRCRCRTTGSFEEVTLFYEEISPVEERRRAPERRPVER